MNRQEDLALNGQMPTILHIGHAWYHYGYRANALTQKIALSSASRGAGTTSLMLNAFQGMRMDYSLLLFQICSEFVVFQDQVNGYWTQGLRDHVHPIFRYLRVFPEMCHLGASRWPTIHTHMSLALVLWHCMYLTLRLQLQLELFSRMCFSFLRAPSTLSP